MPNFEDVDRVGMYMYDEIFLVPYLFFLQSKIPSALPLFLAAMLSETMQTETGEKFGVEPVWSRDFITLTCVIISVSECSLLHTNF